MPAKTTREKCLEKKRDCEMQDREEGKTREFEKEFSQEFRFLL
jgi:hypothetical protein